jgi:asparagine synthase (glutamine-hydrolysing)
MLAPAIAAVAAPFGRDLEDAFHRIERTVAEARASGARMVVFPESALGGYLREGTAARPAPDLPPALSPGGPEIARLIALAGETVVCVGYTEGSAAGEKYSSAVCVSGDGVLGHQRKVHLPPAERFAYTPGDGFAAFDTPVGRVGMLLCYDKLFPEAARALANDGAEIVASLAAWSVDRHHPARTVARDRQTLHFDVVDLSRAIENQVVWVSSNQTGAGAGCASSATRRSSTRTGACSRPRATAPPSRSGASTPPPPSPPPRGSSITWPIAGPPATGRPASPRCSAPPSRGRDPRCAASWPSTAARILQRSSGCSSASPTAARTMRAGSTSADAWLGHRRLSIVDVDGGRQPLVTAGDDLWLVGNGEIYNHAELRERLGDREPLTRSDNEVALHLVDAHGPLGLAELNGMFAFAMAGADGRFVAARDPVGIKPLYWAQRDGITRFASEMHVFDEDWQPLVEPFPPGCAWTPTDGLERFAAAVPDDLEYSTLDEAGLLEETRAALIDAVERQLMGDVPVGVFLSGGLDSSLVAAIAARWLAARGRRLPTFAVGTEDSPDLAAARRVAAHLGAEHHETTYTAQDALEALPTVVRAIESFDPGLVRSAVPNFLLARFTARHVKVVLTGEGADELFAGYDYLRDLTDEADLHAELVRTVRGLHSLNLQRCDRVTMAHGLEARVPFLDRRVVEWGLRVPPEVKIPTAGRPEKWLLRQAFDGWLPGDLLWRDKAEFGDGSGARDVLSDAVSADISDAEFAAERGAVDPPLRTKEELAYYRTFRDHLAGVRAEVAISRFATA